jgi:EAL domain-containing protein (putative c-di-GMP-specific phosphodiesterase class I)
VRRFTVADELKIDGSFIADLEGGTSADEAIVSASIVLARALGLEVVAEGVETARQLEALGRLGCGLAQGHLFSPPVDVDALATFVAGFRWPVSS